jgi:hypothetical protein
VSCAARAGAVSVAIGEMWKDGEDKPDYVINDLSELGALLEKLIILFLTSAASAVISISAPTRKKLDSRVKMFKYHYVRLRFCLTERRGFISLRKNPFFVSI